MATRPQSRTRSPQGSTAAPARPPVRDLTGGASGLAVEWDARTAYDFVFSLWGEAGKTDDLSAEDRRWLKEARAAVAADDPSKLAAITREEIPIQLASVLLGHRSVRTGAEALELFRTVPATELARSMFCELEAKDPSIAATLDRAMAGDRDALAEIRNRTTEVHPEARLTFLEDPEGTQRLVVDVFGRWLEWFSRVEPRIAAIQARDLELRADDRASLAPADLVERTTGGVRLNPDPAVRRVVLAPSYFARPYNLILGGPDWRFFAYPVADTALELDPLAPPPDLVRLYRALGDPTRLRILRLLAEKDLYGTELAGLLELSKPTVSHHLVQLRAAGLITVTEAGAYLYYSLRRERLDDATAELRRFLRA